MGREKLNYHAFWAIALFVLSAGLPPQAHGFDRKISEHGNVLFLPGNAFFPACLPKQAAGEDLQTTETLRLKYWHPLKLSALGNTSGANELILHGSVSPVAASLDKVARYFSASSGETQNAESQRDDKYSKFSDYLLLVYSVEFDETKWPLLLFYNEHWYSKEARLGVSRGDSILWSSSDFYINFVGTKRSVLDDWRYAAEVPPLKLIRELQEPYFGRRKEETLSAEVHVDDCCFIVLEKPDYRGHFNRRGGLRYARILSDGTYRILSHGMN